MGRRISRASPAAATNVKMADLRGEYEEIAPEIDEAIRSVLKHADFIRGREVDELESALADYLNVSHVVGVANGTDALQIAMMALDIGPGDEIITSAFTFIATAEAAALLGATPVFADIDPRTFNIDPACIEALITPRTRAIVPVHLFGQPADMAPILDLARRHELPVIEDNAQAIGAEYQNRKTGSLGDVGCLSFFPAKNLGCYGDGGALSTRDAALHRKIRMLSNHGSERKYYNELVGVNSRLDTLQAAILNVKLRRLDEAHARRREAAKRYDALLEEHPCIAVPHRAPDRTHVYHQYTLRISRNLPGERNGLSSYLKSRGVPHAIYYPAPLHQLPVFAQGRCRCGSLDKTEEASREVLSLPMHPLLAEREQEYVAEEILRYCDRALAGG